MDLPPKRRPHVTIVSDNAETLDGLESYLRSAGLIAQGTRLLERAVEMTPLSFSAVLLFPDDFPAHRVDAILAQLQKHRPKAQRVLVTSDPKRFDGLFGDAPLAVLVVPKPVWGWTILDAIRARFDSEAEEGEDFSTKKRNRS